jgi:hypothetical protein
MAEIWFTLVDTCSQAQPNCTGANHCFRHSAGTLTKVASSFAVVLPHSCSVVSQPSDASLPSTSSSKLVLVLAPVESRTA